MHNKTLISFSAVVVIAIVNIVLVVFGLIYWNYQNISVNEFHKSSKEYLTELLTSEHSKQIDSLLKMLSLDVMLLSDSLEKNGLENSEELIQTSLKAAKEIKGVEIESSEGLTFFYKKDDQIVKTTDQNSINLFIYDSLSIKDLGLSSKEYFVRVYYTPIYATINSQNIYKESLADFIKFEQDYHQKSSSLNLFFISLFLLISLIISAFVFLVFRRLGHQIEIAQEEIESKNRELEKTLDELKLRQKQLIESEKMASLGELVAGISHEINTPIGIGITATTKLQSIQADLKRSYEKDELSEEEFKKYLERLGEGLKIAFSNLQRAGELIKNFKQVAVDTESEERRKFELASYIDDVIKSLRPAYKHKNIKINFSGDREVAIKSYPGAFSQILTNLIQNSLVHGFENRENGEIKITLSKLKNSIILTYKDDGDGIKKEYFDKIYNPFFTTKRNEGGSGLGLNIVYNIITRKLGGSIELKESSKGVFFIIEIPSENT
jgi:signal transduction histidine kinase